MNPDLIRIPGSISIPGEGHPDWRPVRKGLRMRLLFDGPDGQRVALLHYGPGCIAPRHVHLGDEHSFILRGSQQDEFGVYAAGAYVYSPAGTAHEVESPEGSLVLVHWEAPAKVQVYGEPDGA